MIYDLRFTNGITIVFQLFEEKDVCPKKHVKMFGVSICGSSRHLCKPCPAFIPIASKNCPYGVVIKTLDCNNCPVSV